ncbi:hypothetical protein GOP47_0017002 [Adiantum capillus-veneris]|uniref:CAAX prenyl protease 2/Lysostaphin resistance protein A-like domain-containing protein n=1 Tax=Adiantum capillus-veneris TaxID=13818 RepID=A0A9D4UJ43_ADICA|nr:hypothetical protein GOP47_0017002 [Adiantum capillus-veneris]
MLTLGVVETLGWRCLSSGNMPVSSPCARPWAFSHSLLVSSGTSPWARGKKMVVGKRIEGQCLLLGSMPFRSPCLRLLLSRCPRAFSRTLVPSLSPLPSLLISSPTQQLASHHLRPLFAAPGDENSQPVDDQQHELAKSTSGFLVKWEIPWDGKTVIVTITAFGLSFLFTGLAVSVLLAQLGFRHRQLLDVDERSLVIFINQILQTFVGTFVIKICTKSYIPLPRDLFYYDFRDPFSFSRGWLLWSVIGTFCGAAAVLLSGTLAAYINGEPLPRERRDALLQLLPLIGASSTSTALLLAVTGVLAPFLEETLFRGFLMTSLTKWMPTYAAVILSAGAFALAHLTPGQAPQLFALGVVLGFSYSKSGNLLTPIVIHGLWNSGVLLLLTVLRMEGYDIQEMI